MIKVLTLTITITISLFLSCQNSSNIDVKSTVFSRSEIDILTQFLLSFDSIICQKIGSDRNCWNAMLEKIKYDVSEKSSINFLSSTEIRLLENIFPKELETKIWIEEKTIYNRRIPNSRPANIFPDSINLYKLSTSNEYWSFIKEQSEINESILRYYNKVSEYGFKSIPELHEILSFYNFYDLDDPVTKIVFAISLFTKSRNARICSDSYQELMNDIAQKFKERRNNN